MLQRKIEAFLRLFLARYVLTGGVSEEETLTEEDKRTQPLTETFGMSEPELIELKRRREDQGRSEIMRERGRGRERERE